MKNRKLYSVVVAAAVLAVVLPAGAWDCGAGSTLREPYVADAGTAPGKCSGSKAAEPIDFSELPPPVKETVQAQRGTDVITKIEVETRDGTTVYCVQFENHADHARPELVVAADGKIVKEKNVAKADNGPRRTDLPINR